MFNFSDQVMHRLLYIEEENYVSLEEVQIKIMSLIAKDDKVAGFLSKGWQHPFAIVRDLVLEQIGKLAKREDYSQFLVCRNLSNPNTFSLTVHNIWR